MVDEDSGGEGEVAGPALTQTAQEIISDLQQKLLQVQTELQFEMWLKRENMRHVGRLHQDHVMSRRAELERQQLVCGLSYQNCSPHANAESFIQHNRLREYKAQLLQLQKQLKQHQDQAIDMKQKHTEWSTQLQSKLSSLREEKKTWMAQATALNSANLDLKVCY
jgi:DNA anti-recombination protein RmuC